MRLPQSLYELNKLTDDEILARLNSATPEQRAHFEAEIARLQRASQDPTPGALAMRLDPLTVQTKALRLIDKKMIGIRDAIDVMFLRRARFSMLVRSGVDEGYATDQVVDEIPSRGITRLIISMPPQEGKSSRATRYTIEWLLRQYPTLRVGLVSYDGTNAEQFSYQIRGDIELFNGQAGNEDIGLRLAADQKAMGRWILNSGGGVYAIGIGGGLTGRPLDALDIDDPVKDIDAADSLLRSQQAWNWWQTVARPRLAPWSPAWITSTRWSELDLAGRLITKQKEDESAGIENGDKWEVINIPALADHDPRKGETDVLGRKPGEFMDSARGRTRSDWEATMNETTPRFWSALYQGKPTPGIGNVFLTEWWRRYEEILWVQQSDGTFLIPNHEVVQSWDFTFDDTKGSDYVVGAVWAKQGADSKLITVVRARLSFPKTIDAVKRISYLFPQSHRKYVEKKANGAAVISSLRKEIAGLIPVNPGRSKEQRAEAMSPFVRAGNFWLPTNSVASASPEIAFDVDEFINEHTAFPYGTHDDQVDTTSQYGEQVYLKGGTGRLLSPVGKTRATNIPEQDTNSVSPMQRRLRERKESA